jgi:hypothetical protein
LPPRSLSIGILNLIGVLFSWGFLSHFVFIVHVCLLRARCVCVCVCVCVRACAWERYHLQTLHKSVSVMKHFTWFWWQIQLPTYGAILVYIGLLRALETLVVHILGIIHWYFFFYFYYMYRASSYYFYSNQQVHNCGHKKYISQQCLFT